MFTSPAPPESRTCGVRPAFIKQHADSATSLPSLISLNLRTSASVRSDYQRTRLRSILAPCVLPTAMCLVRRETNTTSSFSMSPSPLRNLETSQNSAGLRPLITRISRNSMRAGQFVKNETRSAPPNWARPWCADSRGHGPRRPRPGPGLRTEFLGLGEAGTMGHFGLLKIARIGVLE